MRKAGFTSPVMCTGPQGDILLASETSFKDGTRGVFYIKGLALHDSGWSAAQAGSASTGGEWNMAIAAGPQEWRVACDRYLAGDHDVILPYRGERGNVHGGGDGSPVANTSRFEARPSICYDPEGRLWIAYEEGPERWGKDY